MIVLPARTVVVRLLDGCCSRRGRLLPLRDFLPPLSRGDRLLFVFWTVTAFFSTAKVYFSLLHVHTDYTTPSSSSSPTLWSFLGYCFLGYCRWPIFWTLLTLVAAGLAEIQWSFGQIPRGAQYSEGVYRSANAKETVRLNMEAAWEQVRKAAKQHPDELRTTPATAESATFRLLTYNVGLLEAEFQLVGVIRLFRAGENPPYAAERLPQIPQAILELGRVEGRGGSPPEGRVAKRNTKPINRALLPDVVAIQECYRQSHFLQLFEGLEEFYPFAARMHSGIPHRFHNDLVFFSKFPIVEASLLHLRRQSVIERLFASKRHLKALVRVPSFVLSGDLSDQHRSADGGGAPPPAGPVESTTLTFYNLHTTAGDTRPESLVARVDRRDELDDIFGDIVTMVYQKGYRVKGLIKAQRRRGVVRVLRRCPKRKRKMAVGPAAGGTGEDGLSAGISDSGEVVPPPQSEDEEDDSMDRLGLRPSSVYDAEDFDSEQFFKRKVMRLSVNKTLEDHFLTSVPCLRLLPLSGVLHWQVHSHVRRRATTFHHHQIFLLPYRVLIGPGAPDLTPHIHHPTSNVTTHRHHPSPSSTIHHHHSPPSTTIHHPTSITITITIIAIHRHHPPPPSPIIHRHHHHPSSPSTVTIHRHHPSTSSPIIQHPPSSYNIQHHPSSNIITHHPTSSPIIQHKVMRLSVNKTLEDHFLTHEENDQQSQRSHPPSRRWDQSVLNDAARGGRHSEDLHMVAAFDDHDPQHLDQQASEEPGRMSVDESRLHNEGVSDFHRQITPAGRPASGPHNTRTGGDGFDPLLDDPALERTPLLTSVFSSRYAQNCCLIGDMNAGPGISELEYLYVLERGWRDCYVEGLLRSGEVALKDHSGGRGRPPHYPSWGSSCLRTRLKRFLEDELNNQIRFDTDRRAASDPTPVKNVLQHDEPFPLSTWDPENFLCALGPHDTANSRGCRCDHVLVPNEHVGVLHFSRGGGKPTLAGMRAVQGRIVLTQRSVPVEWPPRRCLLPLGRGCWGRLCRGRGSNGGETRMSTLSDHYGVMVAFAPKGRGGRGY